MLKDFFCKSFFKKQYGARNKIMVTILVYTCAIGYSFIDEKSVYTICQLKMNPQHLIKSKQI